MVNILPYEILYILYIYNDALMYEQHTGVSHSEWALSIIFQQDLLITFFYKIQ